MHDHTCCDPTGQSRHSGALVWDIIGVIARKAGTLASEAMIRKSELEVGKVYL